MESSDEKKTVKISQGSLYLDKSVYETYFNGLNTAILLKRDDCILLMPVHHEAGGGLLMKIRNARGDRVIHAQEFFLEHRLEGLDIELPATWDAALSGLKLEVPDI